MVLSLILGFVVFPKCDGSIIDIVDADDEDFTEMFDS